MATATDERKPLVKDLHEHIVCPLCRGYLIDATTLVECLHSFCRGCIVRRLGSGARACPVCGALTLPPLLPDLALQRLVYLAVPGLYRSELDRRRHFRLVNPQCPPPTPPRGALALTLDDAVSLSLCEILRSNDDNDTREDEDLDEVIRHRDQDDEDNSTTRQIRYLKCPAAVTIRHLVRLLALKRGWGDTEGKLTLKRIEMLYENENADNGKTEMRPLQLSWTLLDLACIFKWDKETPMKLFYRVVRREEKTTLQPPPSVSSCNIGCNGISGGNNTGNSAIMENVQRPPTPPPSPKQPAANSEIGTPSQPRPRSESKSKSSSNSNGEPEPEPEPEQETETDFPAGPGTENGSSSTAGTVLSHNPVAQPSAVSVSSADASGPCCAEMAASAASENHGAKIKKPRCEVTPVMRTPGPQGASPAVAVESTKSSGKVPRLEHHKRRKRRNKRLIAEITTTPREDLLKLKVRLTPCPPRITSSTGSAKEKLLQMRAVRREKIKTNTERSQTPPPVSNAVTTGAAAPSMPLTPPPSASAEDKPMPITIPAVRTVEESPAMVRPKTKETGLPDQEETIEEIIDGIPDEVVRVAQNMNCASAAATEEKKVAIAGTTTGGTSVEPRHQHNHKHNDRNQREEMKKLPPELVIIDGEKTEEKPKDEEVLRRLGLVAISEASKTLQDKMRCSLSGGGIDYHRESLERQLRESKANRTRSLLAEKQMRDTLKSMSKSKVKGSSNGPKKGPPPLAPLTPKQGSFPNPPKSSHPVNHPQIVARNSSAEMEMGKNETPLDLSSAKNALDLSPTPSSGNPVISSTTFPAAAISTAAKSRGKTMTGVSGAERHGKSAEENKKNQDLNLRTLSDAAVSLLSTNPGAPEVRITNSTILGNKVALRIPQPHQRISGFGNGMKIKPNLAVRHIPNPQAFVASQYRNQRTNFFTAQQQPP